jgi:hypothetical protein
MDADNRAERRKAKAAAVPSSAVPSPPCNVVWPPHPKLSSSHSSVAGSA